MTHAILVIPRSIGQLQVQTAHDRKYMIIVNFSTFMAGNKGQKKAPIHITAWLLLKRNHRESNIRFYHYQSARTFSAILNSPYPNQPASKSKQHQCQLHCRTIIARMKSIIKIAMMVTIFFEITVGNVDLRLEIPSTWIPGWKYESSQMVIFPSQWWWVSTFLVRFLSPNTVHLQQSA